MGDEMIRRQIEESEKRFRALVTATSDVVYRMSPDWRIMRTLEGRGFLLDTAEPDSNWFSKYIHPNDQARVKQEIDKAIASKSNFELEHQVLQADGTLGWTFSRAVPILNDQNEIAEWFGAASDITARKRAEEELRKMRDELEASKRLYEAITVSTPDLIYIFDRNYKFIYANTALLNMWGRTWEDSIGQGLLALGYEPWHAEMHEREIDEVIATKKSIRGEVSFPHATLGRRVYDYIFAPVFDEHGEVAVVSGTTRDISDQKQAEEALKKSEEQLRHITHKLEQLVDDRTRELTRSNEDLQQFAHVASHDLKEPVRKVETFASRLKQDPDTVLSEKGNIYMDKILSATKRMSSMIEGVLRYSSLSNLNQDFVPVDLNQVIRGIESDLEISIEQRNAKIVSDNLPTVNGSMVLLYQLFYNLVNNSLKFAARGIPPEIRITCEREGGFYRIDVKDNGIGFPAKFSDAIFETFTRLNSKDQYEGTGLGLSLCKKIVERHGGSIKASSDESDGALFTVLLPV